MGCVLEANKRIELTGPECDGYQNHLFFFRALLIRLLVAGDKVSFYEILLSCCIGEQLFNLELNVLIWFILSS